MEQIIIEDSYQETRHSDDVQDIITAVPPWILRWGTTMFFLVLVLIVGLSALIRYPDIVKTTLKIDSPNAPKPVVAKLAGKLVKLLVRENEQVSAGETLAFIESTGSHLEVISLLASLKELQIRVEQNHPVANDVFFKTDYIRLGELQAAYQSFFQEYLQYRSSVADGFYIKKRAFLQKDLADINKQTNDLNAEKSIQQRDLSLANDEFRMHQKLAAQKVETQAELRQEESKYLAKKSPLVQTDASLITAGSGYLAKEKEIAELDNQINEERSKFSQALNSLISQAEEWKSRYVMTAPETGTVDFAGIVQQNQVLAANQEVFYVNPGDEQFFGEMAIPQNSMGKVKQGQQVLIKLKSYPFEEYGMLRGKISYISNVPYKDSIFISRVNFMIRNSSDQKRPIHLKQGMMADAEIITYDATMFQRLRRNIIKVVGYK